MYTYSIISGSQEILKFAEVLSVGMHCSKRLSFTSSSPPHPREWKCPTTHLLARKCSSSSSSGSSKWSTLSGARSSDRLAAVIDEDDEEEADGTASSKKEGVGKGKGVISKGVIYTIILTNLVSLLIGAGIG